MNLSALLQALIPGAGAKHDGGGADAPAGRPVTRGDAARLYQRPPSFTDLLPWMEYLPDERCFLLEDGCSVGALFELTPTGVEARTPGYIEGVCDGLQSALTDAVPEDDLSPWIVQVYVQDEPSLHRYFARVRDYIPDNIRGTAYSRHYLDIFGRHLAHVARPGGLFDDTAVTGGPWQGQYRRTRVVLYRRDPAPGRNGVRGGVTPAEALNDIATRLETALSTAGIRLRRCDGRDFYEWMVLWFNPASPMAGDDPAKLLEIAPYPGDGEMPYGADFAERLTFSMPRSDNEAGVWLFDGQPHTVVTVQSLRAKPEVGHFTAARRRGKFTFALFDRMPEYTIMAMTIVIRRQDQVHHSVERVRNAAVGDSAEADLAHEEAKAVLREMARGDKLYPVTLAFYVRGRDMRQLERHVNAVNALLAPNGLQPIVAEADLLRLDSYLRNLPMNYDVSLDRSSRRSRLMFSSDIAALIPAYGRSRGTWSPGFKFWNRGGEPLVFDPMSRSDRKKNGHLLLLGPTGSGKSAQLVDLLLQAIAAYRPRVFVIEAGNSHDLLGRHLESQGLSVHQLTLTPDTDVSLPPFADALRLLDHKGLRPRLHEIAIEDLARIDNLDDDDGLEKRDLLGEMEIAARIMVTGGDDREDARLTRADRLLLRNAIYHAAEQVHARPGDHQVLTRDIMEALRGIGRGEIEGDLPEYRRHRATEMADSIGLFCSGIAGHFFNRPGTAWPAADVTILDLGLLAREGYKDQLTLAYISIMNHINNVVERHQSDSRPTIVVTDEAHIITTDAQLARYVVKITKMWRKYGAWFWIATQNLEDFPDDASKMLNMIEWWLCLVTPKEEVDQIARFKDLNEEQRHMLLSTHKEPGKYTEGVVLSDKLETLFRSVPPALSLALAMTEKEEKAERAAIMRERNCTELEAAYVMAARIEAARRG
ncbi:MAG TPA: conjugative transfer ATPase [Thiotrichales bacterium]|nr:conjugative transfer ATPase [Thiotrichales bacterium]